MSAKHRYFISGIGTEIGKTIVSAIVCEALEADYWKPIQSGDPDDTDSMKVAGLLSNPTSVMHPERFVLTEPMSPHASAAIDDVSISLEDFIIPDTKNNLVVEGAGGLMVPLNEEHLVIDLIKKLGLPVILVSSHYLGSINHTLLSVEALRSHHIPIKGIVFNQSPHPTSEPIIETFTGLPVLGRIGHESFWDKATVSEYADQIRPNLYAP